MVQLIASFSALFFLAFLTGYVLLVKRTPVQDLADPANNYHKSEVSEAA